MRTRPDAPPTAGSVRVCVLVLASVAALAVSTRSPARPGGGESRVALRDRIGVTHVAGSYRLATGDFLNEGAEQVLELGSRVVKVYLSRPSVDYPHQGDWPRTRTLVELARTEPYRALFAKPFSTYIITTYRPGKDQHYWRAGVSPEDRKEETAQLYELSRHLLASHRSARKTFVLQHWEGDWALRGSFRPEATPDPRAVAGMVDWLHARQEGVERARREVTSTKARVFHATEVNLVVQAMEKNRPGVADLVLPRTSVDLVSYSAWDAQQNPSTLKRALDYIESRLPPKELPLRRRVFIGEFGAPENDFDPERVRRTVRGTLDTALEWGCPWIVYWQIYCNEPRVRPPTRNEDVRGFSLLRPDGTRTWAWHHIHERLEAASGE